jgi:hypothetical protein
MGWLFPYHTATRRQLLADLTGPHTGEQTAPASGA